MAEIASDAPSFEILYITDTTAIMSIDNPGGYYLKVYLRENYEGSELRVEEWIGNNKTEAYPFNNLSPSTTYLVNLGYNTTSGGGSTTVGAKTFTTLKKGSGDRYERITVYFDEASIYNIRYHYLNTGADVEEHWLNDPDPQTFYVYEETGIGFKQVRVNDGYDYPFAIKVIGNYDKKNSRGLDDIYHRYVDIYIQPYHNVPITIYFESKNQIGDKPQKWYWESTVKKGYPVAFTDTEWTHFQNKINEVREYKGISTYTGFVSPHKGDTITADICNKAWSAINGITGHGTMPAQAVKGRRMTAAFFNSLQNALNAAI